MKKSLGAKVVPVNAPVWLIGTYDKEGRANAATAAWAGICCSKPPCVNFSLRKATYSFSAVLERGAFTVSIPTESQAQAADYFGIASGRDVNKFAVAGLTATRGEMVDAPYVEEFPLVMECRLVHSHELGLHTIFVGEVLDVKCDEALIGDKNLPDVGKLKPFTYSPGAYHGIGTFLGQAHFIGKELMDSGAKQ